MRSRAMKPGTIAARPPFAAPGQCIGLLGGSFNPPHAAHLLVSDIARRRLGLSRLWWIVSPGNPLKSGSDAAPLAERLAQSRRLVANRPITVTGFEAGLASPFTVDTLDFLRRRYPDTGFVWVMGADCLAEFHRWRRWRDILDLVPVAVVDRPGWRLRALAGPAARAFARRRVPEAQAHSLCRMAPPAWTFLTGPLSPLASRAIRAARATRVADGQR